MHHYAIYVCAYKFVLRFWFNLLDQDTNKVLEQPVIMTPQPCTSEDSDAPSSMDTSHHRLPSEEIHLSVPCSAKPEHLHKRNIYLSLSHGCPIFCNILPPRLLLGGLGMRPWNDLQAPTGRAYGQQRNHTWRHIQFDPMYWISLNTAYGCIRLLIRVNINLYCWYCHIFSWSSSISLFSRITRQDLHPTLGMFRRPLMNQSRSL